jgi:pimeloyl-ACP methyl ester carboxylesterase
MTTGVVHRTQSTERSIRQDRAPLSAEAFDLAAHQRESTAEKVERALRIEAREAEHVVFLVPGLLGFERFSTFSYFADRVVAAMRAGLEQAWKQPVPVIAVPIPPTASLRERQNKLMKTLADRLHTLEHGHRPLHVHLVGHSTGGLDADLLTHERPLTGGHWTDVEPRAPSVQARIRSVVSIGSPHQGACIARDPATRLVTHRDPRAIPALAKVCGSFVASVMKDVELSEFLTGAGRDLGKTYRFFTSVLSRWELLNDLQPSRSPSAAKLGSEVTRRSFVTIAGHPIPGLGARSPADAFFRELSRRVSGWETGCAEEGDLVLASVARLRQALLSDSIPVIKADGIELPHRVDAGHNDGVVNSARQLMDPSAPDELAGIVVGDHFDVVGYYDRSAWTVDAHGHEQAMELVSGLLHSGSGFGDNQFFELYRSVANVIADAAH